MYASIAILEEDSSEADRDFPLSGSERQLAELIRTYRAAGLDHLVLAPRGLDSAAEYSAFYERVRQRLLPMAMG
jgi:hypothetical protein